MAGSGFKPKVSVVVPAFNAELTVSETLLSARSQTYRELEILVVDDGSSDRTCEIVERQADEDPRVILIRQSNSGVAAARNVGAKRASGDFLAPLDADDIWYPRKIELQLEQFANAAPEVGLVYAWSATIDMRSRIIRRPKSTISGWVLPQMALRNFIGNSSSPLIRASAFRKVGGYDTSLRARNAQALEDRKLYLELAEQYRYALVPEFLTGYRVVPGNMSSDVMQVLRSHDAVVSDFLPRHPELAGTFHESRNRLARYLLRRALKERRFRQSGALIQSMIGHDARFTFETTKMLCGKLLAPR